MPAPLMDYLRRFAPGLTRDEAAALCGVSVATFARRLRHGLHADEVLRAARAVGAPALEALVETGLLDPDEAQEAGAAVRTAPDRVLLDELHARALAREHHS